MNTENTGIYNWLLTGIKQPADRFKEIFYLDKKEKEFFSILITDYFLFEENLEISKNVSSSYSTESLEKLAEKMRRIEIGSDQIVSLPRLGNSTLTQENEYFQEIDSFLNLNAIDISNTIIWIPGESGDITISIN